MRRVLIESPFAANTATERLVNLDYLRACALDCLARGEAPFASHALYTRWLHDENPAERKLGIEAGLAWGKLADATVVYTDRGTSAGVEQGIARANIEGRVVEYRKLGADWEERLADLVRRAVGGFK